jgi:sigma-B regulation protein RsbU (phosphoserine phosphatase)
MAKGVGGDYYTVRTIGDGNLLLVMCDVSGKGISASLISAILGGMIGLYDFSSGVRKFLVKLNEYITSAFEQDRFISGMFIKFNGTTGECTLYDLGHSMAYLYRGEKLMWLGTAEENLPVGVTRELVPRGARFQLQSGDLLLLCTDGLVEQVDDAKEQYGVRRLISVLKRCAGKDPRGIKDELLSDVARHRGTQPQHDDITLLLLEYK